MHDQSKVQQPMPDDGMRNESNEDESKVRAQTAIRRASSNEREDHVAAYGAYR
jgi:hypothetical protein